MNGRSAKVVVVGSTYLDIALKCNAVPVPGESVSGSGLAYAVTGPGPRQAIQAANCGCKVQLISKTGGGYVSDTAKYNLLQYQVDTGYIYTAESKHTGIAVTLVDSDGDNTSIIYEGANTALLASEIRNAEQVISEADVCLIHGHLPTEAIVEAINLAKIGGTKTILNPARPIEASASDDLPMEYFGVDLIIPNLYEAADITDQSTASIRTAKMIGSDLVARGVGKAIITMGSRGCVMVDRDCTDHIPAFEIELVDQTGCGDAFAGALAAYCAVKDDIHGAIEFASAAGALACSKFGSAEALPTKAEIIELLQKHS